jgi:hypothetical protein
MALLPPVQKALIGFAMPVINVRSHSGHTIESIQSRLLPLLSLVVLGIDGLLLCLCCLHSKKIARSLSDPKNDRIFSWLGLGITLAGLAFVTAFSYRFGRQWLNSDHASEMILAEILAEDNTLVSVRWNYSTELRLVYQTIFSMPLFKVFGGLDNWAFIRAATICLNSALLIASYIFLMRQMRTENKWIYLSAVFLLAPLSTGYWSIVSFGGYYSFFIIQNFCCLALFFRITSRPEGRTFRRDFILFSALSLVLGVQGIRSLFNIQIPLALACFSASRPEGSPKKKTPVYLGVYSFVLCGVGFVINYMLHFVYSFHSFEKMRVADLYDIFFIKLGQNLIALFSFFGFAEGDPVLSARGIISIAALVFTLYLAFSIIALLRKNPASEDAPDRSHSYMRRFIAHYLLASVIFNIFVFQTVEDAVTRRYFIPFLILYVPLIALIFEKTEKRPGALSKTGLISAIFLFIFTRSILNFQILRGRDVNSVRTGYINYLLEHKLNFGFAGYWDSSVTTELTNGKIRIAGLEPHGLEPGQRFNLQGWLNPKEFFEASYYEGESFLLLRRAEWDMARQSGRSFAEKHPDYDDGEFIILRYPQAAVIHETVLDK